MGKFNFLTGVCQTKFIFYQQVKNIVKKLNDFFENLKSTYFWPETKSRVSMVNRTFHFSTDLHMSIVMLSKVLCSDSCLKITRTF